MKFNSENGGKLAIIPANAKALTATLSKGSKEPFEGWVSHSYGEKDPSTLLKYTQVSEAPTNFQTIILPFLDENLPSVHMETLFIQSEGTQDQTVGFKLQADRFADYFIVSHKQNSIKSWENFQSDADLIYLRRDKHDTSTVFLYNSSFLAIDSDTFFQNAKKIPYIEFELINGPIQLPGDYCLVDKKV